MRAVTVAENLGEVRVPGEKHRAYLYKLRAGSAWRINDATRGHVVISVDRKVAEAARYTWTVRWIDGRSVAVFKIGEVELAQPVAEDPKARDRRLGSTRKRAARKDATAFIREGDPEYGAPAEPRRRKPLSIVI